MKILAVGDPHCKVSSIQETRLLQDEIVRLCLEHKVDACVILGDLHDTFETAHVLAYNAIVDLLAAVSKTVWTFYVVGNHDMVNNSGFLHDDHFFKAMKHWNLEDFQLTIVDQPRWVPLSDLNSNIPPSPHGFVFAPYVPPGRFREALSRLSKWNTAEAIFCHQEFKGASMGAIESKHGDEWSPDLPLVISGHIHPYQHLSPNIVYVGTPYTTSFGETEKKTVSLFTFPVDGPPIEERLAVNIPRKVTIRTHVKDIASVIIPPDAVVRLVVEGSAAELTTFKKGRQHKELSETCKVICKPLDADPSVETIQRQNYIEILKEACAKESPAVKRTFDEVTQK